ncbi:MAG TPA: hypothetical protein VIH72_04340, partial [Candidatus Acidoferrales bacterium]
MRRVAGNFGRFAVVMFVLAGAAWGQESSGISFGVVEARRFDSIRLLPDVKAGAGSGTTSGLVFAGQGGTQSGSSAGQNGTQDAPGATTGQSAPAKKPVKPAVHRFWDTENILLFAGVGAARGLDYASTLNIRRRGINEAFLTNAIVDNHAEFAAIEAAATAASIGVSYIFHATGHHRLERWV